MILTGSRLPDRPGPLAPAEDVSCCRFSHMFFRVDVMWVSEGGDSCCCGCEGHDTPRPWAGRVLVQGLLATGCSHTFWWEDSQGLGFGLTHIFARGPSITAVLTHLSRCCATGAQLFCLCCLPLPGLGAAGSY